MLHSISLLIRKDRNQMIMKHQHTPQAQPFSGNDIDLFINRDNTSATEIYDAVMKSSDNYNFPQVFCQHYVLSR